MAISLLAIHSELSHRISDTMTDLIRFRNGIPQWPYSGDMLRLDEPRLSLSAELPEHELATLVDVGVFVKRVKPTDPPFVDASIQRVEVAWPIEVDGVWTQQWAVVDLTPEEQAEWREANTPPPDYVGFYQALLISQTYQQGVLPLVLSGQSATISGRLTIFESQFSEARNGRAIPSALQASLWILLAELQPTQEMVIELQALLEQFHLSGLYTLAPPQP